MNDVIRSGAVLAAVLLVAAAGLPADVRAQEATPGHLVEALPDGGRISVQPAGVDAATINGIRQHLQAMAVAFGAGEVPESAHAAHMESHPGISVMLTKRAAIAYVYTELPRGAELRIITRDAAALQAVHEFLAHLRQHGMHHGGMPHGGANHGGMDHGGMHHGGAHEGAVHQGGTHQGGTHHPTGHRGGGHAVPHGGV